MLRLALDGDNNLCLKYIRIWTAASGQWRELREGQAAACASLAWQRSGGIPDDSGFYDFYYRLGICHEICGG